MAKKLINTILFIAIFSLHLFAQNQTFSISGSVFDKSTNTPLAGVNIFISNTFIGTTSDTSGTYELKNCPAGVYKIVFSMVGYERVIKEVTINKITAGKREKIKLHPKSYALDQVNVVTDESDWKNLYEIFYKEFIGTREFGDDCKILDPYKIELIYDKQKDRLTAICKDLIVVENYALGYKIELLLSEFIWDISGDIEQRTYSFEPKFTEMVPEDEDQLEEWKENRYNTYKLSKQCFFKKLISREVNYPEFIVQTCKRMAFSIEINSENYYPSAIPFIHDKINHFYSFSWPKCVSIVQNDGAQQYHSYIESIFGKIAINENFRELSTNPVTYTGYWSTFRISDLLPDEYSPSPNE